MDTLSCEELGTRGVNQHLATLAAPASVQVTDPGGRHNLAVGSSRPRSRSASRATPATSSAASAATARAGVPQIDVDGFVGWSVGENLMGGVIRVRGSASQSAGSSARGGLIMIEGDASLRAGISLKGGTVAIAGDAGAMSGFMAQAGTILIGGNAGHGLGDSLYEAVIYVAGTVASLGADAVVRGDDRRRRARGEAAGGADGLRPHRPRPRDQGGLGSPALPLLHPQPRRLLMSPRPRPSSPTNQSFPPEVIARIHEMADTGLYPIRGLGARRKLPTFDDLVFLTASVSRYPLEGYRERCETTTVLGARHGAKPLELDDPHHHRRDELRRPVGVGQRGPRAAPPARSGPRPPPGTAG